MCSPNNANCRGSDGVGKSAHGHGLTAETLWASICLCNLRYLVTSTLKNLR